MPVSRLIGVAAWVLAVFNAPALAEPLAASEALPAITLIIDDMGYNRQGGERALQLPGALTYSFLPHTPVGNALALRATALGKDVLMHQPMEAEQHNRQLGPGAILLGMSREQILATLHENFTSVPGAIGINNHMGSLFTAEREPMQWVMQGLKQRGNIIYIDSRTTGRTVAAQAARDEQVPFLSRDVFLDNEPGSGYVRGQFQVLIEKARQNGYALAICHPRADTLGFLEEVLPELHRHGVRLARLPELLILQQRSTPLWQQSSSLSLKAARN